MLCIIARAYSRRNASENPTGIETGVSPRVATVWCWSQRIRKPNRDWNCNKSCNQSTEWICRNASENPTGIETSFSPRSQDITAMSQPSENPTGIETYISTQRWQSTLRRNASENPTGIETLTKRTLRTSSLRSQRIRKPNRDWNSAIATANSPTEVATHQKTQQGLKLR